MYYFFTVYIKSGVVLMSSCQRKDYEVFVLAVRDLLKGRRWSDVDKTDLQGAFRYIADFVGHAPAGIRQSVLREALIHVLKDGESIYCEILSVGKNNELPVENHERKDSVVQEAETGGVITGEIDKYADIENCKEQTKTEQAATLLADALTCGCIAVCRLQQLAKTSGISWRLMHYVKEELGVKSVRKADGWYWERN